jgi:hypothetical protein
MRRRHAESGYRTLLFLFDEIEPLAFTMEAAWMLPESLPFSITAYAGGQLKTIFGKVQILNIISADPVEQRTCRLWVFLEHC